MDDTPGGCCLFTGPPLADTWTFDGAMWQPKLAYVASPINGHRYALTPPMTWQEAESLAVLEGGHLATVRSQAEHNWIWQTLGPGHLHIGLNDIAVEGSWEWISGELVSYTNWGPGEPQGGTLENVVVMANSYAGGLWADISPGWQGNSSQGVIELPVTTTANATTYGTGCGTPVLGFLPTANPIIGTTAGALISNAPTSFAGVTMGWSDSHLAGVPLLPLDLAFIGMPGCSMLVSNDVFGLPVTPLTATTLQFDYAIPYAPHLLGTHVYVQAYCVAPSGNPLQIIASNGIDWLIGNQ